MKQSYMIIFPSSWFWFARVWTSMFLLNGRCRLCNRSKKWNHWLLLSFLQENGEVVGFLPETAIDHSFDEDQQVDKLLSEYVFSRMLQKKNTIVKICNNHMITSLGLSVECK